MDGLPSASAPSGRSAKSLPPGTILPGLSPATCARLSQVVVEQLTAALPDATLSLPGGGPVRGADLFLAARREANGSVLIDGPTVKGTFFVALMAEDTYRPGELPCDPPPTAWQLSPCETWRLPDGSPARKVTITRPSDGIEQYVVWVLKPDHTVVMMSVINAFTWQGNDQATGTAVPLSADQLVAMAADGRLNLS